MLLLTPEEAQLLIIVASLESTDTAYNLITMLQLGLLQTLEIYDLGDMLVTTLTAAGDLIAFDNIEALTHLASIGA